MTPCAHVYRWHGSPETGHALRIGTVWVGAGGRAAADIPLEPEILDPRSGRRIPVTDGAAYVDALPFHFRNPPYMWAEAAIPPRPDMTPHGYPLTTLGWQAEAWSIDADERERDPVGYALTEVGTDCRTDSERAYDIAQARERDV